MIKRIAFFSAGFAFNRQNRMLFYEKIFPKNVKIFLITTDKYAGKESEMYQQEYKLSRTKIIKLNYNLLTLPFQIRKICCKERIDRLINLGFHTISPLLLLAEFLSDTKVITNLLVDVFDQYKMAINLKDIYKELLILLMLFPVVWFSEKVFINDKMNFEKAPYFFRSNSKKFKLLYAPVDSKLFYIKNKKKTRMKLKIPLDKKVVVYAGRISYLKCSDILKSLISSNPDVHFILIGRILDKEFINFKADNLEHHLNKTSYDLLDLYNASDLGFCMTRSGGGMGIAAMEMLSCGVPVIVPSHFNLHSGKAILQAPYNIKKVDAVLKDFFNLDEKKRKEKTFHARNFIENNFSYKALKKDYIDSHLY